MKKVLFNINSIYMKLIMNNIRFLLLVVISCLYYSFQKVPNKKEVYISENLPKIEKLDSKDYEYFLNTMRFNDKGALIYWDDNILEKAYPQGTKEYNDIIKNIVKELGYNTNENIVLVSAKGDEYVIKSEEKYVQDLNGKKYTLSDLANLDGFFSITSLACGTCLVNFRSLNQLEYKGFKIAFLDKIEELEKYKKSYRNEKLGFLNNDWIIFDYNDLVIKEFISNLKLSHTKDHFPYYFIREKKRTVKESSNLEDI